MIEWDLTDIKDKRQELFSKRCVTVFVFLFQDDFDGFSKNDVFQTETKLTKLKNEMDVLEKEVLR